MELHSVITATMVHGPCGDTNPESPCMAQQVRDTLKCNKVFSKALCQETMKQANVFLLYQKRPSVGDGATI